MVRTCRGLKNLWYIAITTYLTYCLFVGHIISTYVAFLLLVSLVVGQRDKVMITDLVETTVSTSNKIDNSKPVYLIVLTVGKCCCLKIASATTYRVGVT